MCNFQVVNQRRSRSVLQFNLTISGKGMSLSEILAPKRKVEQRQHSLLALFLVCVRTAVPDRQDMAHAGDLGHVSPSPTTKVFQIGRPRLRKYTATDCK